MNPLAFLVVTFGCIAILAVFVSISHYDRAELLSETLQEHTSATQGLISHMEAVNRHNREIVAGSMMVRLALDVEERLWVADGERNVP